MSLSANDLLQIILTIKTNIENYHSNNVICKELGRLTARLGFFIHINFDQIETKLQDISVNAAALNVKEVLERVVDEIRRYLLLLLLLLLLS